MRKHLLTLCVCLCLASPGTAETVSWLYEVEVPVSDQSRQAREEGARAALLVLLTRLSGLREIPEQEVVLEALEHPDRYYNGFRFFETEQVDDDGEVIESLLLRVQFDRGAALRLIKAAGLPIWRADRPRVVAWVVVDDMGGRRLVGANEPSELLETLSAHARQRGVPLVLPLLDLEDRMAVGPGTVWGRLRAVLEGASRRYGADVVLVGRAERLIGGSWATDWDLWLGDERVLHQLTDYQLAAMGAHAADFVVDALADRLAVASTQARGLSLAVSNIGTPGDYGALLRYLNALEIVDGVSVDRLQGNRVDVSLTTRAEVDQLLAMFETDRVLAPMTFGPLSRYDAELSWVRR